MSGASTATSDLVQEKLDQAVGILGEQDVDLWLTFVRETMLTSDPALDLLGGVYCAWHGAFLVSRSGERVAIVGRFDAPALEALGAYDRVVGYDESIRRRCARSSSGSPRDPSRSTTPRATPPPTGSRTDSGSRSRTSSWRPDRPTASSPRSASSMPSAVGSRSARSSGWQAPFGVVEEANVFTLEFGTAVPGRGYVGLEEDVLVTTDGVEWLSTPQRDLWLVR